MHLACEHLRTLGPRWQALLDHIGECQHQTHPHREPYEALMRAVAYQQLTTRAGDAMILLLLDDFSPGGQVFPSAEQIAASEKDALRQCGFSTRKVETLHLIAQGGRDGLVPTREQALTMGDDTFIERLSTLKGIERWMISASA
ncbi:MAG: hypothetical protein ACR5LF_01180 [Symbiopectobacterium sp.]